MLIEQYIFIIIFLSAFAFFIIIHIAYPFWVHMPVSHIYDIHHRFYSMSNPAIKVLQQYPYKNKWVSKKETATVSYHDLCDATKTEVIDQLHCNYIPSDSILFTIEKKHLDTFFSGHFDTPFVTTYIQNVFTKSLKDVKDIKNKPLGCICSYPVHILYRKQKTTANNLVFLACDRENPIHKEITRKLIATHEYTCRNRVTDIKISLLKKHIGKCEGVKPLLTFSTHLYYIQSPAKTTQSKSLPVIQVYRENWSYAQDILDLMGRIFDFCAYIDVGAMKARVDAGQLWIFAIKYKGDILAAYFIEDAMMLYEKVNDYGGKTLNLVGSVYNMKDDGSKVFIKGFANCLALIQKQNRDYTMLLMDDVGHNKILCGGANTEIVKTTGAYYLINGLLPESIDPNRAFMGL